jgi:tripartite ATP-independent transporter DctP family solute receptor
MKKNIIILCVLVLIVSMFVGCGGSNQDTKQESNATNSKTESTTESSSGEKEYKLRAANVTQVDHPMNKSVEFFISKVQDRTEGRIEIANFPARQLGGDRELFEQVQQGSLDMALISAAPVGSTNDVAAALQLPYMFKDWDHWLEVMSNPITEDLMSDLESNNVKVIGVYDCGFRHFLSVDEPIKSMDNFVGKKIRVGEAPLHIAIFKALGSAPTPLPYGEIYTSFQNKVIDGIEMDLPAMVMEKHYEVATNMTISRHFTWPAILMVNLDLWNSMSAEDQQLFMECGKEVLQENIDYTIEQEEKALAELKANGINIVEFTDEERQALIDATKPVTEEYMAKNPKIKAFADFANSLK